MFKEKTSKKRLHNIDNSKDNSTLDAIHLKTIKNYSNKINEEKKIIFDLNILMKNQNIINNKIINTNMNSDNNYYNTLWNSNIGIKEHILLLKKKIKGY